ncbi:MAG: hypothetical protein GY796_11990 [Chloroflexi bacterium]|nr:hypothetical protein [Chloroflexota bacterium]
MNQYPSAIIEKAKKQEKLLQAHAAGKTLAQARAIVGITKMRVKEANRLQRKYEAGSSTWEALLDGRFGHDIKANSAFERLYIQISDNGAFSGTTDAAQSRVSIGQYIGKRLCTKPISWRRTDNYLHRLACQHTHALSSFIVEGEWQTVFDDASREAVYARWRN